MGRHKNVGLGWHLAQVRDAWSCKSRERQVRPHQPSPPHPIWASCCSQNASQTCYLPSGVLHAWPPTLSPPPPSLGPLLPDSCPCLPCLLAPWGRWYSFFQALHKFWSAGGILLSFLILLVPLKPFKTLLSVHSAGETEFRHSVSSLRVGVQAAASL